MRGLLKAIQQLNNCDDLTNLLEIQDTKDELDILNQLFAKQREIIEEMIKAYISIDKEQARKQGHGQDKHQPEKVTHKRAIEWLTNAKQKVEFYIYKANQLTKHCEEVERGVSDC